MIDIASETLITPKQYCRLRPPGRNGRPMHISTFYRHAEDGLEVIKIGGSLYTSVEAAQRHFDRLTAARSGAVERAEQSGARTPAQRAKASERAARELDSLGV